MRQEVTRQRAAAKTREILQDPRIQVLPPSQALFLDGLALYEARLDKQYSLTDCISMHVMRREGLTDVLTNDHHLPKKAFASCSAAAGMGMSSPAPSCWHLARHPGLW